MPITFKQLKPEFGELKKKLDVIKDNTSAPAQRPNKVIPLLSVIVTTIATAVIAWATFWNWKTVENTLVQIGKQVEEMQETNKLYQETLRLQDSTIAVQREMLVQQEHALNLQSDYYQKTVRPFVYFENIALDDFKKTIQDTTVSIKYYLKNVGALPAKEVQSITLWDSAINEKFKTWAYEKFAFLPGSSIFPNQVVETLADRTTMHSTFLLSAIEKRPYLHTYLVYEDTGGKLYFYKAIGKIQTSIEHGQLKWNILSLWVEFD